MQQLIPTAVPPSDWNQFGFFSGSIVADLAEPQQVVRVHSKMDYLLNSSQLICIEPIIKLPHIKNCFLLLGDCAAYQYRGLWTLVSALAAKSALF